MMVRLQHKWSSYTKKCQPPLSNYQFFKANYQFFKKKFVWLSFKMRKKCNQSQLKNIKNQYCKSLDTHQYLYNMSWKYQILAPSVRNWHYKSNQLLVSKYPFDAMFSFLNFICLALPLK